MAESGENALRDIVFELSNVRELLLKTASDKEFRAQARNVARTGELCLFVIIDKAMGLL